MFLTYFFEGLIVGSLSGLALRPVLDSYLVWRRAKAFAREDAVVDPPRVNIVDTFEAPQRGPNGHGQVDPSERARRNEA